jgi:beta-lactamase class A
MPGQRPYASRGVPRRATTRRSSSSLSTGGFAALLGLLGVIGLTVFWVVNPFAPRTPAANAFQAAPGNGAPVPSQASGAAAGPLAPEMMQVAAAATPGAPAPPTIPMVHQWQSVASGMALDPALVSQLEQALAGVDGHVSIAVKDLATGRGAVLDGDREMPSASLYKLPVLFSVFEAGLNMGEDLPITEESRSYDSGTMELGVGETLTVAEALERMVTISDNTAAVMLGSRVGANRINSDLAGLGMDTTHYSIERMTTSALDMLRYLDLLAHGKMVSPAASADMLHLMLRQRVNDRLPRLLPDGVQVAHKTGNLPGTVNDVGIVYGPSSSVAIAALVSDTSDEASAATGIAKLALAAYTYFEEQPGSVAGRPLIPPAPARPIPPVWREPRPVATPTPLVASPTLVADVTVEVTPTSAPVATATGIPSAATQAPAVPPAPPVLAPAAQAPAQASLAVVAPTSGPTQAATVRPTPPPPPATATPVLPTAPPATPPPPARPTSAPTHAPPTATPNRR